MTRRAARERPAARPRRAPRAWVVPALAAAIGAVLSSGLTSAYFLTRMPETIPVAGDLLVAPEHRHLAALLVAPAEPYRAESPGAPVAAQALGADALRALGFRRGWTRGWSAPSGERVDAFLLEFADARGAAAYARGTGRAARLLADPRPFEVAGVPGGSGLLDTVRDGAGRYTQLVALHRGPLAVLLVAESAAPEPAAEVLGLARRQFAALG